MKRKKISDPSVVGKINIFPDAFIQKAYNQYLADQQDGFVSNIDSYLESTYPELTKHGLDSLKKLILKKVK